MVKVLIVASIMVVINMFMIYAVSKAAGSLETTVRRFYVARLGMETEKEERNSGKESLIISGKSEEEPSSQQAAVPAPEIVCVQKEPEAAGGASASAGGAAPAEVKYKNPDFREDYLTVQRLEALDAEAALESVIRIQAKDGPEQGRGYARLLEFLDYDTALRLSFYGPQEQEEILRETLPREQEGILEFYLSAFPGTFSVIDFYDWLKEKAQLYDGVFYIHGADGLRRSVEERENVKNVPDSSVTAGMKIVYQNRLYDYSI